MDTANIKEKVKKDFNNAVALMSILPVLSLVYIIVGKISSLAILEGEVGYMLLIIIMLILLGITTGRKILWILITKIIDMQNELVEKSRLAAISETVLSLGHEIVNPLSIVKGNLDILADDIASGKPLNMKHERIEPMLLNCNRINDVMSKMMRISKPSVTIITDGVKMLDLDASELIDKKREK